MNFTIQHKSELRDTALYSKSNFYCGDKKYSGDKKYFLEIALNYAIFLFFLCIGERAFSREIGGDKLWQVNYQAEKRTSAAAF